MAADVTFAATSSSAGAGVTAVTESESPGADDGGHAALGPREVPLDCQAMVPMLEKGEI